jgi:hypothetical protein
VWWCLPVIPVLGRLRHKDLQFQSSLGYPERPPSPPKNECADTVVQKTKDCGAILLELKPQMSFLACKMGD